MSYEYSGYLSTILYKPDPAQLDSTDSITFGPKDIEKWSTKDIENALEWQNVLGDLGYGHMPLPAPIAMAGLGLLGVFLGRGRLRNLGLG